MPSRASICNRRRIWNAWRERCGLRKAAAEAKVRRFVGIGTCFEYDLSAGHLSVETALRPSTPYAEAKAAAFAELSRLLPQQGVEFAWCRLFYLYGEGEDERRLVPYLRGKLMAGEPAELTSGKQIRDYLDVARRRPDDRGGRAGRGAGSGQHLLRRTHDDTAACRADRRRIRTPRFAPFRRPSGQFGRSPPSSSACAPPARPASFARPDTPGSLVNPC